MKTKLATACLLVGALVASGAGIAADSDSDRSSPTNFVKDSVITTKIKTKLAGEQMSSMAHIQVDTDDKGVVWLSGTAHSQADIDKAVSIARGTENVRSVNNHLTVKKDD